MIKKSLLVIFLLAIIAPMPSLWSELQKEELVFLSNDYQKGLGDRIMVSRLANVMEEKGVRVVSLKLFRYLNFIIDIPALLSQQKKFFTIIQAVPNTSDKCNDKVIMSPIKGVIYFGNLHKFIGSSGYDNLSPIEKCGYYSKLLEKYNKSFDHALVASPDDLNIDCSGHAAFAHLISWYPTMPIVKTNPEPIYNKLFYSLGALWDSTRSQEKYFEFAKNIGQLGIADIYGKRNDGKLDIKELIGDGFKDRIKGDHHAFTAVNQQYIGSLITHSNTHIDAGIPSGKIFESVAIRRAVISDEHPWVRKNFGDTVFYVDMANLSAEEITKQIAEHHAWILANPEKSQVMIDAAYKIFIDRFSLEQQVEKILPLVKNH